jgi:hypothetical protein
MSRAAATARCIICHPRSDCIINISGFDLRKGHPVRGAGPQSKRIPIGSQNPFAEALSENLTSLRTAA